MKTIIRDPAHLKFIRTLCCSCCGAYPAQAAHIRVKGGGGVAEKSGEDRVLPQCHKCHMLSHQKGEMAFYRDVDKAIELARGLYLFSGDTFNALSLIARMKVHVYH